MINKQKLFAIFAAISISALPLHAAEEKELAADLELNPALELDQRPKEDGAVQENPEDKRVDLYREGINAFTRLTMVEKNHPLLQAFAKIAKEEQLGIMAQLFNWAFPPAKTEPADGQPVEEPVFNFEVFSSNATIRVPIYTTFCFTWDSNSKNKAGEPLLDADPNTWINNPAILNRQNLSVKSWEGSIRDGKPSIGLSLRAAKRGTSRFVLDNEKPSLLRKVQKWLFQEPHEPQYWIDIVVE
jgi:hypothetical protein